MTDLDPIRNAVADLARQEEALLRRMLCAWDPRWGEPELVYKHPSLSDLRIPARGIPDQTYRVRSSILGLAPRCQIDDVAHMMVLAVDHIDDRGRVKAPMVDKGMLAVFEARAR